jgi:hypothetical protein
MEAGEDEINRRARRSGNRRHKTGKELMTVPARTRRPPGGVSRGARAAA